MKKHLFFMPVLLATLLLTACDENDNEFDQPGFGNGTFILTAQTEGAPSTRAGITGDDENGYKVIWQEGDDIYAYAPAFGDTYVAGQFFVAKGAGTTSATFSATKPINPDAYIWAPEALGQDKMDLTWPAEQTYSAQGYVKGIPMYCTSIETTDNSQQLQFKNLGGLLRFTLKGSEAFKLTAIEVSSSTPMAGSFTISEGATPTAVLKNADDYPDAHLDDVIRLNVPSVPLSPEGESFYLSLVPGSYNGIKVKFCFADQDPIVRRLSVGMDIKRSEITPAELSMPSPEQYQAGHLLRVDEEWDQTAQNVIDKVKDLTGIDNPLLNLALSTRIYYSVHLARLIYYTKDPTGALVEASGIVAYQCNPSTSSPLTYDRMVSIQHGTCNIADAPSYMTLATELLPVSVSDADASNPKPYVAVMADYLGYGRSQTDDLQTPYMHGTLTGSTCADMISAAEEFLQSRSIKFKNNKLDLIGYSQGGAATLQTLLELERRGISDDRINEVWAGAGPYDLVGFMDAFKNGVSLEGKTGYVPFTLRGICYGENLQLDKNDLYNSSLLSTLNVDFMFSNYQLSEWHERLGSDMTAILHPDFYVDGYNGNTTILSLIQALDRNSLINQAQPANVSKVKLYHSATDDTVPFACSEALKKAWPGLGSINVLETQNNHLKGGIEFMLYYAGLGSFISYITSEAPEGENPETEE